MQDHGTALVAEAADGMPSRPVTVLSALVLRTGRASLGDSREVVAARAGVSLDLVAGIEDGTCPAWDVPGPELFPIAVALGPVQGETLWTAVACDLLLTSVLSGDWVTAGVACAETLGDFSGQAGLLLRWAVQGREGGSPLLAATDRDLLRVKAAELAASGTADAWVGTGLLALSSEVRGDQ